MYFIVIMYFIYYLFILNNFNIYPASTMLGNIKKINNQQLTV